jgi:hypothetical protein
MLASESDAENSEYLYKSANSYAWRQNEHISVEDWAQRGQFGFYAPADEASSDDNSTRFAAPWRQLGEMDGSSISSAEFSDDDSLPSDDEEAILEFEPDRRPLEARLLADEVSPALRRFAPGAAMRGAVRIGLREDQDRLTAVLMALHPRLGRQSSLRLLDTGILALIVQMDAFERNPHLASFGALRRELQEEAEATEADMLAEMSGDSSSGDNEEDAEQEGELAGQDGGVPGGARMSRASQRRLAEVIASATADMARRGEEGNEGGAGPAASVADTEEEGTEDGPAALDEEAGEALATAAASYLSDLEELAAAVALPPATHSPPPTHCLLPRQLDVQPTCPNVHPHARTDSSTPNRAPCRPLRPTTEQPVRRRAILLSAPPASRQRRPGVMRLATGVASSSLAS